MKPISALVGAVFTAFWLAVLKWSLPYGLDAFQEFATTPNVGIFRVGVCAILIVLSGYWLWVGVIWTLEDLTGKGFEKLKPRWLRR